VDCASLTLQVAPVSYYCLECTVVQCKDALSIYWNRHGHECSRIWKCSPNFTLIQWIKIVSRLTTVVYYLSILNNTNDSSGSSGCFCVYNLPFEIEALKWSSQIKNVIWCVKGTKYDNRCYLTWDKVQYFFLSNNRRKVLPAVSAKHNPHDLIFKSCKSFGWL
jgi:hypothetical protein